MKPTDESLTFVPGDGDVMSPIVFVGEAPGETEDRMGKPFVGKSGNLLAKLLRSIDWNREDVYITNLVKYRPPDNRDPEPTEASAARVLAHWELKILRPKIVVPLGRFATEMFYPSPHMATLAGTKRVKQGFMVVPMYHPSAGLRSARTRELMFEHIQLVKRELDALG